jgi:hypothetical protein
LQVEIHPLRIYLTEAIYRMLFDYVFPKDDYHPFNRQEAWRQQATLPPSGSTSTSSTRRTRRNTTAIDTSVPSLSRQNSGDSLKSPHSPKPTLAAPGTSPGAPWPIPTYSSSSPVDMDPELMAEVSRVSHTRQQSSSGYSSGEPLRGPGHRRTASAIEFGSNDSALLEAVVAQPASAGRSGSYSGPLAMTAQTVGSLGQGTGLRNTAAILVKAANEGSESSDATPPGKKRRKARGKTARPSEEEEAKSKALVIQFIKIAQVRGRSGCGCK